MSNVLFLDSNGKVVYLKTPEFYKEEELLNMRRLLTDRRLNKVIDDSDYYCIHRMFSILPEFIDRAAGFLGDSFMTVVHIKYLVTSTDVMMNNCVDGEVGFDIMLVGPAYSLRLKN